MTRECKADFSNLTTYIVNYRIASNLDQDDFVASLKRMHKGYFAAITWNAEIAHKTDAFMSLPPACSDHVTQRLSECVSDFGSSLFNWANGNYKAARVMLRVSIENAVRGISAVEEEGLLEEKNAYKLFEQASKLGIFNQADVIRELFDALHADYKLLCRDAHTATAQDMEHLTSLAGIPAFDQEKSLDTEDVFVRVTRAITSIFCITFNQFFHQMHHRNKENVLNSLQGKIKPHITAPSA